MESKESIAKINLKPGTYTIQNVTLYVRNLRFKCKRCATFCCKLGGPPLSEKDVKRLKRAGYKEDEFLEKSHHNLRNRADGSCVFLQSIKKRNIHECSIYNLRPTLCRLYPFHLEKAGSASFMLKIMPCRGINRRCGELVDTNFFITHLIDLYMTHLRSFINSV